MKVYLVITQHWDYDCDYETIEGCFDSLETAEKLADSLNTSGPHSPLHAQLQRTSVTELDVLSEVPQ